MNIIVNKINFIKYIYDIKKEDIFKDIQIINNSFYLEDFSDPINEKIKKDFEIMCEKECGKIKNEEIEKEIKVIINGEIKSNILTNKFNKEGKTIIYLISQNDLTDMSYIFSGCSSLTDINLSSFNTNHIINLFAMFHNCSALTDINLSSFDTNQVTNMSWMFFDCSSFNTNQVTNMSYMFGN